MAKGLIWQCLLGKGVPRRQPRAALRVGFVAGLGLFRSALRTSAHPVRALGSGLTLLGSLAVSVLSWLRILPVSILDLPLRVGSLLALFFVTVYLLALTTMP